MGGTEGEHQFLVVEISGSQVLYLEGWGFLLYASHVGIQVVGITLTGLAVVGMGSGTYPEIGCPVPVAAVVAGAEAGTAEVGDLIVLKAGIAEMGAHAVIHGGAGVVIGRDNAFLLTQAVKRGALLIGEAVGGNMLNRQACGGLQVLLLDLGRLAGEAVHEVYTDVVYVGIVADGDCIHGLPGGMAAAEKTEQVIIEGLDTHTDPVDSRCAQGGYVTRCDVIGITLNGKFSELTGAEQRADAVNDLPYLLRREP